MGVYPTITSRRMPYDIDGTEVGKRNIYWSSVAACFNSGIETWLSSNDKVNLNKFSKEQEFVCDRGWCVAYWFFFPEVREITHIGLLFKDPSLTGLTLQGSNDTTNGINGTWETASVSWTIQTAADGWRYAMDVSFSTSYRTVRFGYGSSSSYTDPRLYHIHLYGMKAEGQTPDDIVFCDSAGVEYNCFKDWGDTPEGSTNFDSFYMKNVSSKIANALNLQLNDVDFVMSFDQSSWATVLNISSLNSGQISPRIYVKKTLGPPNLVLGPRFARVILTIGSFT